MAAAGLSSPALTRIPREARNLLRRHPPVCFGPAGAPSIASGLSIAIETAIVAGTFKQIGDGEFLGDIFTLSLLATGVRFVPEASCLPASRRVAGQLSQTPGDTQRDSRDQRRASANSQPSLRYPEDRATSAGPC
jgi:hypothetical protein